MLFISENFRQQQKMKSNKVNDLTFTSIIPIKNSHHDMRVIIKLFSGVMAVMILLANVNPSHDWIPYIILSTIVFVTLYIAGQRIFNHGTA